MFELIPDELKQLKQWVCWSGDKIPKNAMTGKNAKSNDPETWSDFDTAVEAVSKYHFSGIGFMFAQDGDYFGVDLDKCIENTDFVDEFVETLKSYNEFSRSGNGIHIICKGKLPDGSKRHGKVEMYSAGRYFITTGKMYNEKYHEIVNCTESIKPLKAKYLPEEKPVSIQRQIQKVDMSDQEIIDKARNCKTGSAFQMLYSGSWQGTYPSQSEADLVFCNILAFWTQRDKMQMDRIFRSSGLMREKWDRKTNVTTYGNMTLDKAIAGCTQIFSGVMKVEDIALQFFDGEQKVVSKFYYANDTGNAQRFFDKFAGEMRYSYNRKKWMFWNGKKLQYDDGNIVKTLADEIVDDLLKEAINCKDENDQKEKYRFYNRTASSKSKENFIKEAQHLDGIPIQQSELDTNKMYLNCQNGIVNLRNGELLNHDVVELMSKITYCEYDNSGKVPSLWLSFLDDVTGGDKELQRYLQKCVGYSLTGETTEQCAFFLYGMGNNGKSTFIDTISNMMGEYASNVQADSIMIKHADNSVNTDIARLKGARFVTSSEPEEGKRLNEGLIKQLTGGDKVTCRFLFGDEFEYEPEFKLWIGTNHRPIIRGTDIGIWRRIRLIPFEVIIPPDKVDKSLKYKLSEELPQILAWAVEGCIAWQKEGFQQPYCVETATKEYKSEMDSIETFVESCLIITNDSQNFILTNELYSIYKNWAKENNEYEMTSRKFSAEIIKKLPDKKRIGAKIAFSGVKFAEDTQKNYEFSMFY